MHRIAAEIISLLRKANLTPTDFLHVTDRLTNSADDIEGQVIALLAPLPTREKQQVMSDLAEIELARA